MFADLRLFSRSAGFNRSILKMETGLIFLKIGETVFKL